MEILKHMHSGIRWVLLITLLAAIAQAFMNMKGTKPFDRKFSLIAMISGHLQAVIGLILYFANNWYKPLPPEITDAGMKSLHRFFQMEHITMMLLAVVLMTIGNSKAKKGATDNAKYKSIAVFFTIALVMILASIPWPFMQKFSGFNWF